MSLATDSIFYDALSGSSDIVAAVSGRIYGTAIPLPDEDAENTPAPYVIITFDGLNNDSQSKDCPFEGEYDTVTIGIEVTAETLTALHNLAHLIRATIRQYMEDNSTEVEDYQFSAQAIQYDSLKPCYWQRLTWQCSTKNDYEYGYY